MSIQPATSWGRADAQFGESNPTDEESSDAFLAEWSNKPPSLWCLSHSEETCVDLTFFEAFRQADGIPIPPQLISNPSSILSLSSKREHVSILREHYQPSKNPPLLIDVHKKNLRESIVKTLGPRPTPESPLPMVVIEWEKTWEGKIELERVDVAAKQMYDSCEIPFNAPPLFLPPASRKRTREENDGDGHEEEERVAKRRK